MIRFNGKNKGVHESSFELQPHKHDPVSQNEGQSTLVFFTAFLVKWTPLALKCF